jgi:DNA replication licensing factor MCM2
MAEAHARMHLRDNVRDDDVDVAISVLLESFIQTQKVSVAKLIRKKFSTYLTFKDENTFLVLNLLNKLIREKIQYRQLVRSAAETHEIKVLREELEEAARELQIFDLT